MLQQNREKLFRIALALQVFSEPGGPLGVETLLAHRMRMSRMAAGAAF